MAEPEWLKEIRDALNVHKLPDGQALVQGVVKALGKNRWESLEKCVAHIDALTVELERMGKLVTGLEDRRDTLQAERDRLRGAIELVTTAPAMNEGSGICERFKADRDLSHVYWRLVDLRAALGEVREPECGNCVADPCKGYGCSAYRPKGEVRDAD